MFSLGDVGSWKKRSPIEKLQDILDDQNDDIKDLKEIIDNQSEVIEDLKSKIKDVTVQLEELYSEETKSKELNLQCETRIENLETEMTNNFDQFTKKDQELESRFSKQKETTEKTLEGLIKDISNVRLDIDNTNQETEINNEDVIQKLTVLRRMVEELKEKTWELDTNTRNNLVIYGVKVIIN